MKEAKGLEVRVYVGADVNYIVCAILVGATDTTQLVVNVSVILYGE